MKKIIIYTDGASRGNPGLGSWGALLIDEESGKYLEIGKSEDNATNNQMELTAAIEALKAIKKPHEAEIYSDSSYVVKGMNEWVHNWVKRNWIKSDKKPVENKKLWEKLLALSKKHNVSFHWVRGHSGNRHNERVDKIANILMDEHNKTGKKAKHEKRGIL